jgi:hypothetical protein
VTKRERERGIAGKQENKSEMDTTTTTPRKRSFSSESKDGKGLLNEFVNTLNHISRDHGGVEKKKKKNEKKKRNVYRMRSMNLVSKIITPILCFVLFCTACIVHSTILNVLSLLGIVLSTLWLPITAGLERRVNYTFGFLLFSNWFVFWMLPIVVQGAVFKLGLHSAVLKPIYDILDQSKTVRSFASKYVYKKEKFADFFATQVYFIFGALTSLALMIYYHQTHDGKLPFYIIMMYNFAWIGPGGRSMGAAYSIAHKEGHFDIYRKNLKQIFGNLFENVLGVFYGSVPYNFTTTHISIHHRIDAGRGDTLYNWDISRSSVPSFLLYLVRGLLHTSGLGGLWQFYFSPRKRDRTVCFQRLLFGIVAYWIVLPAIVIALFDFQFYFYVVLQPLLCMTFFLSIINHGFHGFIQQDSEGKMIDCVASTTMIGSLDDYFGEDDHMAHHHHLSVYYRDLPNHQRKQRDLWIKNKASVFQGLDVFTVSIYILLKAYPLLSRRYMDFSGKMKLEDVELMLKKRANRRETRYSGVLPEIPWGESKNGDGRWNSPEMIDGMEDKALISRLFPGLDTGLLQFQRLVCDKMDEGMPPVKPICAFE